MMRIVLTSEYAQELESEKQEYCEKMMTTAMTQLPNPKKPWAAKKIHGKQNHKTTDDKANVHDPDRSQRHCAWKVQKRFWPVTAANRMAHTENRTHM